MNVRRMTETTLYVALSAALGFISFLTLSISLAVGIPTLLLALAGAPLVALAFFSAHVLARIERRRAAALLGIEFPTRAFPREGSVPVRAVAWVSSRGAWMEMLYGLVALPIVGALGGALVFWAWGAAIGLLSYPLWGWATPGDDVFGLPYVPAAFLHLVLGLAALGAAPWLGRGIAAVQVAMARLLLEPGERERLSARVDTLEETRAGMVAAADAERRRIERDLHDGAQQRLVALAMTLGRARASEDPVHTQRLVAEAHGEAKEALVELRNLARGIHPAVLTDRGLDAAVSALAARCPVPVAVDVDLPLRCSPGSEAIAYFFVAEALTNVAKHAQASRAWLSAELQGDRLVVEVLDNGIGGAELNGTGLVGLRDRVRAVDGEMTVVSPLGHGTNLRVELPCER
ncbi:sensor histidine kinase [Solirubrobacter phytolaccae]|uniref:histidine kinase n=1 Tax=Solirubrobacter phytolaccae TaxID=1404360 RepID=A0A9X3SBR9_9ACTN|nr:sensor histidine kinase [Solirubrobacter phytolaccae]MDA0184938.1 sensor histidine kinase [Solirubrobacter phytolaccae]